MVKEAADLRASLREVEKARLDARRELQELRRQVRDDVFKLDIPHKFLQIVGHKSFGLFLGVSNGFKVKQHSGRRQGC